MDLLIQEDVKRRYFARAVLENVNADLVYNLYPEWLCKISLNVFALVLYRETFIKDTYAYFMSTV